MFNDSQFAISGLSKVKIISYRSKNLIAYFDKISMADISVSSKGIEASGGKGAVGLIPFNVGGRIAIRMQLGKLSLWSLAQLTNGAMEIHTEPQTIKETAIFYGATYVFPRVVQRIVSAFEIAREEEEIKIVKTLAVTDYVYSELTNSISITGENEFSTKSFMIEYEFEAPCVVLEIIENAPVPLYTIEADAHFMGNATREEVTMKMTIPCARLTNLFHLLMMNLDNKNQNYSFEFESFRPENSKLTAASARFVFVGEEE